MAPVTPEALAFRQDGLRKGKEDAGSFVVLRISKQRAGISVPQ
jgi:hypothetical protein